jgi:hypothetical protein
MPQDDAGYFRHPARRSAPQYDRIGRLTFALFRQIFLS